MTSTRNRETAVKEFEEDIRNNQDLLKDILELDGKNLGCWCQPLACHGMVLQQLIQEAKHTATVTSNVIEEDQPADNTSNAISYGLWV